MLQLDELEGAYRGKSAVLICGGPSTPSDLRRTPWFESALWSVNIHGILMPDISFIYYYDRHVGTVPEIRKHPARRVSHQKDELLEGDVFAGICPDFGFSGAHSVWIAAYMGFSPIFLAGADCYGDYETDYWHQYPGGKEERMRHAKNDHADHWIPIAEAVKDKAEIVSFSDPLKEIFK